MKKYVRFIKTHWMQMGAIRYRRMLQAFRKQSRFSHLRQR